MILSAARIIVQWLLQLIVEPRATNSHSLINS